MTNPVSRDWWRILQWPLFLAVSAVAAWVSYTQQRQLGIDVGWDSPWGLPVILDGLAAATLLSYIRKPGRFNRAVSTLAIATAIVGNAQAAIYDPDTANLPAPLWVVVAWKVLPPVAVFTIAHYIAHERKETGSWQPKSSTAAAGIGAGSGAAASGSATPTSPQRSPGSGRARSATPRARSKRSATRRSADVLAQRLIDDNLTHLSLNQITDRFSVAKTTAKTAKDLATATTSSTASSSSNGHN